MADADNGGGISDDEDDNGRQAPRHAGPAVTVNGQAELHQALGQAESLKPINHCDVNSVSPPHHPRPALKKERKGSCRYFFTLQMSSLPNLCYGSSLLIKLYHVQIIFIDLDLILRSEVSVG